MKIPLTISSLSNLVEFEMQVPSSSGLNVFLIKTGILSSING